MELLELSEIRHLATEHGYKEIDHNIFSKSISFRGGPSNSTRINVYYTTGTIGTSLNHPRRGKSQLFRRGIKTLDQLKTIFSNPRVHTGGGYYTRKNVRQQWKKQGTDQFLRDSARRWVFVAQAIGLTKNDKEINTIVEICTEWDNLYWEPSDLPSLHHTKYACGSHGGLLQMLYQVVRQSCGDFEICEMRELEKYHDGLISRSDLNTERPYDHECNNLVCFLQDNGATISRLKEKFMSLRKDIRIELAQWFLARDVCGYVFADAANLKVITTPYSEAAIDTHIQYGKDMYPKKGNLCNHCGVVLDENDGD